MKLFKSLSIVILYTLVLLVLAKPASASLTWPNFTSCANPQGTVRASFDSGTHGIVGDSGTYTGKDSVYTLSDNTLTQCLCVDNGEGIQTNWWKITDLSADDINVLKSEGWVYIANGSAWGLDEAAYLAKNSYFACTAQPNVPGGSDGHSDGRSDGHSDGGSSSPATSQGMVLGLASTGNTQFILATFLFGFALIGAGLYLNSKKSI